MAPTPTPTRVHIARDGSLRQLLPAFVLCHYLLYTVPVVGALWLAYAYELVPRRGLLGCVGAYLASIVLYRPHLGRGWWWGRPLYESSIWDGVAGFLDTTFVREAPLAPDRQYIFAICPHGILSVVRALFLGSTFPKLFPSVYGRWVGATPQFLAPFGCRETMLLLQAIDASKKVLLKAIGRGESLLLLPGGTKELMLTDPSSSVTRFACRDRLGFVRLAVASGMPVVPVVCFGEKWCYRRVLLPEPLRGLLYRALRLPGTLFFGQWGTLLGHTTRADGVTPISFGIVYGAPIEVRRLAETDAGFAEHVAEVHAQFLAAMASIFERYKAEFGYAADETLEIVDANPKRDKAKRA